MPFLCLEYFTSLDVLIIVYQNSDYLSWHIYSITLFYEAFLNVQLSNKTFIFLKLESSVYTALKYMSYSPFMMVFFFLGQTQLVAYSTTISPTFWRKKPWLEEQCSQHQGMNSNVSKSNMSIPFSFATHSLYLLSPQLDLAIWKKSRQMRLSRTVKGWDFTLPSS